MAKRSRKAKCKKSKRRLQNDRNSIKSGNNNRKNGKWSSEKNVVMNDARIKLIDKQFQNYRSNPLGIRDAREIIQERHSHSDSSSYITKLHEMKMSIRKFNTDIINKNAIKIKQTEPTQKPSKDNKSYDEFIKKLRLGLINSTTSAEPVYPNGYKIMISNLHKCVVDEDIKELFSDVGKILKLRIIQTGIAEVIYSCYNEAVQAIEKYHNKYLDGKPMKCEIKK